MNMIFYGLMFAGVTSIALGILHIPRLWGSVFATWHAEVNSLGILNRKLVNTVLYALCFTLITLGLLTLVLAGSDIKPDRFQVWFLALCALFWIWRLLWQVFNFPIRKLKPGARLLALHLALVAVFVVNTIAYVAPVLAVFMNA